MRPTGVRRLVGLFSAALAAMAFPTFPAAAPAAADTPAPPPTVLHAAPGARDPGCSAAHPCSLTQAQQKVRAMLVGGMDRNIEIRLADGTYPLSAPLALTAADSGRDGHTVSWTAEPGAHPVLSGGVPVTGWRQNPGDGTWTATVPDAVRTPRQLYVNGTRAVWAQSAPCPRSVCATSAAGMAGATSATTGIAQWSRPTDAEAVIRVRWRDYHCRIAGVSGDLISFVQPCWTNSGSGTGRTGPAWDTTSVTSSRYTGVAYFANARELLHTPGQFVWDSAARTVTYLPRPGEDLTHAQVIAPATEQLITLAGGAHDIDLRGLTLAHTAWDQPSGPDGYAGAQAGLSLTGATGPADQSGQYYTKPVAALTVHGGQRIAVADCVFTHLGGAGARLETGTTDSTVTRSLFTDLSSGALYVGDTEPHPAAGLGDLGNTLSYNTITAIGTEFTDAVGIWAGYTKNLTIRQNTLDGLPYSGISVGWGWDQPQAQNPWLGGNTISGNRIWRVMDPAIGQHDGGAIYTQGQQPGTVISGNYVNRTGIDNGIYLDEQSSYIHVTGNVVTRNGVKWLSNWADYGIENHADHNWTDSTTTPPLSGQGSTMTDNWTGLTTLPPDAVAVAQSAGAGPWPGPVEQLRG